MRAPIQEHFSCVPEVLIDQASFSDVAVFPTPEGEVHLSLFARAAYVEPADGVLLEYNGKALGVELVAYYCDEEGRVYDWEKRYEVTSSTDGPECIRKLRALMANGLARLWNFEGLMQSIEETCKNAHRIDWDQMPSSLQ